MEVDLDNSCDMMMMKITIMTMMMIKLVHNSVNFQAMTSRFWMEVDLDITYNMMMMMMDDDGNYSCNSVNF